MPANDFQGLEQIIQDVLEVKIERTNFSEKVLQEVFQNQNYEYELEDGTTLKEIFSYTKEQIPLYKELINEPDNFLRIFNDYLNQIYGRFHMAMKLRVMPGDPKEISFSPLKVKRESHCFKKNPLKFFNQNLEVYGDLSRTELYKFDPSLYNALNKNNLLDDLIPDKNAEHEKKRKIIAEELRANEGDKDLTIEKLSVSYYLVTRVAREEKIVLVKKNLLPDEEVKIILDTLKANKYDVNKTHLDTGYTPETIRRYRNINELPIIRRGQNNFENNPIKDRLSNSEIFRIRDLYVNKEKNLTEISDKTNHGRTIIRETLRMLGVYEEFGHSNEVKKEMLRAYFLTEGKLRPSSRLLEVKGFGTIDWNQIKKYWHRYKIFTYHDFTKDRADEHKKMSDVWDGHNLLKKPFVENGLDIKNGLKAYFDFEKDSEAASKETGMFEYTLEQLWDRYNVSFLKETLMKSEFPDTPLYSISPEAFWLIDKYRFFDKPQIMKKSNFIDFKCIKDVFIDEGINREDFKVIKEINNAFDLMINLYSGSFTQPKAKKFARYYYYNVDFRLDIGNLKKY